MKYIYLSVKKKETKCHQKSVSPTREQELSRACQPKSCACQPYINDECSSVQIEREKRCFNKLRFKRGMPLQLLMLNFFYILLQLRGSRRMFRFCCANEIQLRRVLHSVRSPLLLINCQKNGIVGNSYYEGSHYVEY